METKMFEVRDRGTMIPVVATKLSPDFSFENRKTQEEEELKAEDWLLKRAGYDTNRKTVLLSRIEGGEILSQCDPLEWFAGGSRTMKIAHEFIRDMFDSLASGEVIDVEYLLKEKPTKKISERIS